MIQIGLRIWLVDERIYFDGNSIDCCVEFSIQRDTLSQHSQKFAKLWPRPEQFPQATVFAVELARHGFKVRIEDFREKKRTNVYLDPNGDVSQVTERILL